MTEERELNGHYQSEDLVSVWVGIFPNQQSFDDYLEEIWPDDEEEDKPVECAFWQELGISWNDHDFQEAHFEAEPVDIATLLSRGLSFVDSYGLAVRQACQERCINRSNAIVLIFEYDYPVQANFISTRLTYLGSFPYSTGGHPFRRG